MSHEASKCTLNVEFREVYISQNNLLLYIHLQYNKSGYSFLVFTRVGFNNLEFLFTGFLPVPTG